MRHGDIDAGLRLCRASRWNQVARDWARFLEADPSGTTVAVRDGRVIGSAATIRYGGGAGGDIPGGGGGGGGASGSVVGGGGMSYGGMSGGTGGAARFGWIGMVLVEPDARGQGLGTALLSCAVDALGDVPARLDATPAGHPLYLKRGFVEEYRLRRMQGVAPASSSSAGSWSAGSPPLSADVSAGARADTIADPSAGARADLRPMAADDLPAVIAWDARVFGAPRPEMLAWMHAGAPAYATVAFRGGRLAGYAFGRHGFHFEHLGPIVAADAGVAGALATDCLSRHAGREFIIDASCHAEEWTEILTRLGFREQRPFIRMCRGGHPPFGEPHQQFAMLGPEFG